MAKKNKFKSTPKSYRDASWTSDQAPPVHKPSSQPLQPINRVPTRPREPDADDEDDDASRTRPRKTWPDGDKTPVFAPQTVPIPTPPTTPEDFLSIVLPSHLLTSLQSTNDIHILQISAGAKIQSKVTQLLDQLENGFDFGRTDQKAGIVAVVGKGGAAGKAVSVVEIAKRELERSGFRWWQYSGLGGRVEEFRRRKRVVKEGRTLADEAAKGQADVEMGDDVTAEKEDGEEDEEDAFQTMQLPERSQVRAIPYLTIFMSRVPIALLRNEFGEQTFDPAKKKG